MNSHKVSRTAMIVLALLIAAVPLYAGKRRAVHVSPPAGQISAELSGTVLDNVSGQPVASVKITVGSKSATTNSQGKYSIRNIQYLGTSMTVQAERSGYVSKSVVLTTGGKQVVDFRLDPLATATVRLTNGTTYQLDVDSMRFGYLSGLSDYIDHEYETFCKPDGTSVDVDRLQIKKITGPAVSAASAPCCTSSNVLKVNLELKSGEKTDVFFVDSCQGYSSDVIARDHVTGKFEYISFKDIAELVFP